MKIFQYIFCCLLLSACQEEYELPATDFTPRLVVDGQVTSEYTRHELRLSQTGDYGSQDYPPASGATIILRDGIREFLYTEVSPGRYLTDSLAGMPGSAYRLIIMWEGEQYEAIDTMGTIPPAFEPVTFSPAERGGWEFEYRRHQFGFESANAWILSVSPVDTTEMSSINYQELGQQIGVEVDSNRIYTFEFFTHPNISVNGLLNFEEAHFYGWRSSRQVVQRRFSLSDDYYNFLRSSFMETEWRGNLFDSSPANVKGNVSNGALGFFNASAVRELVFVLE